MKKILKRVCLLVMVITTFITSSITAHAATNVSFSNIRESDVTTNSARVDFTTVNPGRMVISQTGIEIKETSAKNWQASKTDNVASTYQYYSQLNSWYLIGSGKEVNINLKMGTKYQYRCFTVVGGQTYYSDTKTFTTKGDSKKSSSSPKVTITQKSSSASESNSKMEAFISDSRFSNGTSWEYGKTPLIAAYSGWGCCAYAADFVKYCYGIDNPRGGTVFYNVSEIRAGDVLTVGNQGDGTGHWMVCIKRDGNKLYIAEGNYLNTVRVGWNYTISGNKFAEDARSFTAGYHFTNTSNTAVTSSQTYEINCATNFPTSAAVGTPIKLTGTIKSQTTFSSVTVRVEKKGENTKYRLYDSGTIKNTKSFDLSKANAKLNLSNLPAGSYKLEIAIWLDNVGRKTKAYEFMLK